MKTNKKEIVRKSELLAQIRADLKAWEEAEPDFDDNYFDESDVMSYYEFLTDRYRDEWIIIDDTKEGGGDEGTV
ncbi:hypothetical protein [Bacteroides eggerthii]|uniref:Integrase n=1 Tax=Bacteroides eggerthii TaxID=28111 RepID=A0A380YMX6_9BACE|nr:hypothetical protein [Bacteroides eggerthii]EEC53795.1 hypothetical protein BACEGG_01940 [Bacteroides eggerthii DSM 20697]QRQ50202.1 hypothetical protein I6J51_07920 [Bacteroides eggerthii]UWN87437.1 hypothetical protein NQ546_14875 [Bacteroides eggerthii]SUV29873.1 integrase [Bacteroides eggerthii]